MLGLGEALAASGLEVATRPDGTLVARALDETVLADALAALGPLAPGQRVEVDPIALPASGRKRDDTPTGGFPRPGASPPPNFVGPADRSASAPIGSAGEGGSSR